MMRRAPAALCALLCLLPLSHAVDEVEAARLALAAEEAVRAFTASEGNTREKKTEEEPLPGLAARRWASRTNDHAGSEAMAKAKVVGSKLRGSVGAFDAAQAVTASSRASPPAAPAGDAHLLPWAVLEVRVPRNTFPPIPLASSSPSSPRERERERSDPPHPTPDAMFVGPRQRRRRRAS